MCGLDWERKVRIRCKGMIHFNKQETYKAKQAKPVCLAKEPWTLPLAMNREFYRDIIYSASANAYTFSSVGRHGTVPKIVVFQSLKEENQFNLFLSDFENGVIADDHRITDNGDMPKVMATVVQIIHHFTDQRPKASVLINGSDDVRKRLYARIVANNFESLQTMYEVKSTKGVGLAFKPSRRHP